MDLLVRRWVAAGEPRKGWVFPGRVEGRWMSGSWVTHEFKRLMKDAGLPETLVFHSLRHLSLSLMLAAGVELPVVSRIAGHATVAVTAQVYSHVVSGRERQGVEALDLARWHPVGE
jgi:integrase